MGAGYTIVQYGSVQFFRVITEDCKQELVRDQTGTDMLYVKTRITILGYVHGHSDWNYQVVKDGTGATYRGSAGLQQIAVRGRLEPRGAFQMWTGCSGEGQNPDGTVLFDVDPFPLDPIIPSPGIPGDIDLFGYDLSNGPYNTDFTVVQICGDELFKVRATFEFSILECQYQGDDPRNTYGVLSNRWSSVDSLDANLQTTRTYTGQLVCATSNVNIHSFRWMTIPRLVPLMRIEGMRFEASADGLKLNWSITHKEIAYSVPWPARTWSVVHHEELINGMISEVSVDVDLTGDSTVDKSDLIELAQWIVWAKVYDLTPPVVALGGGRIPLILPKRIAAVDYTGMEAPRITLSAIFKRPPGKFRSDLPSFGNIGTPLAQGDLPPVVAPNPAYDASLSWGAYPGQIPEFEGPAKLAGLFACFLQTPCNDGHSLNRP